MLHARLNARFPRRSFEHGVCSFVETINLEKGNQNDSYPFTFSSDYKNFKMSFSSAEMAAFI
jgi:hypothetical protein